MPDNVSNKLNILCGKIKNLSIRLDKFCSKHVVISSLKDLPSPSGDIITLESGTLYIVCGIINLEGNRLVAPSNVVIWSQSALQNGFITSNIDPVLTIMGVRIALLQIGWENSDMTIPAQQDATPTGPGVRVVGTSVGGNIIIENNAFVNCETGLELDNVTNAAIDTCAFTLNGDRGIVISSDDNEISSIKLINNFFVNNLTTTYTAIEIESTTTAVAGSISIIGNSMTLLFATQQFLNISTAALANINRVIITNNPVTNGAGGTAINASVTTNPTVISATNVNIPNSNILGSLSLLGNTATTSAVGVWSNISTNVPLIATPIERYTITAVGGGLLDELTYIGKSTIVMSVTISVEITTAAGVINQVARIGGALNGTAAGDQTAFLITQSQMELTILTPALFQAITSTFHITLSTNDRIKPIITNVSGTGGLIIGTIQMTVIGIE